MFAVFTAPDFPALITGLVSSHASNLMFLIALALGLGAVVLAVDACFARLREAALPRSADGTRLLSDMEDETRAWEIEARHQRAFDGLPYDEPEEYDEENDKWN